VPGLSGLTAQELTVLIANLNTRNDQLRAEVATLEHQVTSLIDAAGRGESAVGALRADLARARTFAGLDTVSGQGVRITVSGPIDGAGVSDLVNELRNAGAEAIAVDGLRLLPRVVVSGPPGAVGLLDSTLGDDFEILAIGSSQILTGTLTRAGGVIAQLAATAPQVSIVVTPSDEVVVPGTTLDLRPVDARPRL
jgi:uncharacterized protein YlxW (UPF0749 family)